MSFRIQEKAGAGAPFLIGEYRVEPLRNSLLRGEETLRLRPTAMAVLVQLALRPRKVLTKDEILSAVWSDRFVSEGVLHNAIAELRQVLNDDPKKPWAIETIHGRGYRLIAPVIRDLPPSGIYLRPGEGPARRWRAIALFLLAAIVVAGVVLALIGTFVGGPGGLSPGASGAFPCEGTFLCRDTSSETAYRLYLEGVRLAAAQEGDEAIRVLENALAEDPGFVYACDLLANLYDTKHLKEIAREKLAACREGAGKEEFFRWLLRRREAQVDERWEDELEALGQLARLDPENPEWHHRLGFFYLTHHRDCDRSLEQHRQAVAGSTEVRNLVYLAEAELRCGEPAEALKTLAQASPEDRKTKSWLILRGLALRGNGRAAEAESVLEGARERFPKDPWLLLALGDLRLAQGAPAEALELYRSARSKSIADSDYEPALCGQGRALLALGRPREAKAVAEEARSRPEASLEAFWLEGMALVALGELEAAARVADEAEERLAASRTRFQEEWVRHLRGSVALARGDSAEAAGFFQEALDALPLERSFFLRSLQRALGQE